MPDLPTYLAFIAAVLVMQATPGPETMLVIARGIGEGTRVAVWTVLGTIATGLIQVPLLALGIASLITASPVAFEVLRWLGAAYLIWLGARLLLGRGGSVAFTHATARRSAHSALLDGMISNLTNPTPILFMLAFLPQFVDPAQGSVAQQLAILGTTQKLSGLLVQGSVALASGAVGLWLAQRPRFILWQARFAGSVMVLLGLRLLLAGDARPARV